jgi:hypothetical protein
MERACNKKGGKRMGVICWWENLKEGDTRKAKL